MCCIKLRIKDDYTSKAIWLGLYASLAVWCIERVHTVVVINRICLAIGPPSSDFTDLYNTFCDECMLLLFLYLMVLDYFPGLLVKHRLVTDLTLGLALRTMLDALHHPPDTKVSIGLSCPFISFLLYLQFPIIFETHNVSPPRYLLLGFWFWSSFLTASWRLHSFAIIFWECLIYVVLIQHLLHLLSVLWLKNHHATWNQMAAVLLLQPQWKLWRYKISLFYWPLQCI